MSLPTTGLGTCTGAREMTVKHKYLKVFENHCTLSRGDDNVKHTKEVQRGLEEDKTMSLPHDLNF